MRCVASCCAMASITGWCMPAPAPWAKTNTALAFSGRSNNAETSPWLFDAMNRSGSDFW